MFQPFQRKYWNWKEKTPTKALDWFSCIDEIEPAESLVNLDLVINIWPFDETRTVLEFSGKAGGHMTDHSLEEIENLLKEKDLI